jgi:hypothetical protein
VAVAWATRNLTPPVAEAAETAQRGPAGPTRP